MLLEEFDITYVTQKSIKGQAIVDHLAHLPLPIYDAVRADFPNEEVLASDISSIPSTEQWIVYFDGALNENGNGVGIVLQSPEGVVIPKAYQLGFPVTNNVAEYEALIAGLKEALYLKAK